MFESINKPKTYLLLGNIFLIFFLILFSNLKQIPFHLGDFLFLAFLAFIFALYRPGWCFLLFVGTLPLENINLAPIELGIAIRPYQLFGALAILALVIRILSKKIYFELAKPIWQDWLVLLFAFSGFLSVINSPEKALSFKLSIIISSFVAFYFLVRNYIQNIEDLKKIVPFFLSSSMMVIFYGIWQNWQFLHNLSHFEAMPGRPNSTFTEADWLGGYLVLLTGIVYILIYHFQLITRDTSKQIFNSQFLIFKKISIHKFQIFNYLLLTATFILLIITVSRSAWVGALFSTIIFLFIVLTNLHFRNWKWREALSNGLKILASGILAVGIIYLFHLTNFQLFNRVQSTGSGMQKVTVSCEENKELPEFIDVVGELKEFGCRYINLEEINSEMASGHFVKEIYRRDPNVAIRSEIYKKSWAEIKNHPILGIGWGSIGQALGRDGRGVVLNSSNIFLETWLGAGALGVLILTILLIWALLVNVKNYFYATDNLQKTVSLFMVVSWFAIIIPNMFNAGIFLGFFWVWLGVVQSRPPKL